MTTDPPVPSEDLTLFVAQSTGLHTLALLYTLGTSDHGIVVALSELLCNLDYLKEGERRT